MIHPAIEFDSDSSLICIQAVVTYPKECSLILTATRRQYPFCHQVPCSAAKVVDQSANDIDSKLFPPFA